MSRSWEASTAKAEATASVIMAKKIARTRNEKRPMITARISEARSASAMPMPMAPQVALMPCMAIAMP